MCSVVPKDAVAALNKAGFAMFLALCSRSASENVFLSPFSVDGAFGLAYCGGKGDTAAQIRGTLGLPDGVDACGSLFSDIAHAYDEAQDVKIYVSNSVWADLKQKVLESYLAVVKKYYGGAFYQEDFGKGAAVAQKINSYVESHTNHMIKDLLSPSDITPDTSMVLLNTLYFEADWAHPFKKESTTDHPFHLFGGAERTVRMMHQKVRVGYFANASSNVHGVVLPYKNRRFALVALMPTEGGEDQGQAALGTILGKLGDELESWLSGASAANETQLWLPRTKLDYKVSLASLLQSQGMKTPFAGGAADFSGISGERDLYISDVIHQTALEMDEVSTKAAAATAIMKSRCLRPMAPVLNIFRADRPFVVIIRDMESALTLFVGRVNDPGKGPE